MQKFLCGIITDIVRGLNPPIDPTDAVNLAHHDQHADNDTVHIRTTVKNGITVPYYTDTVRSKNLSIETLALTLGRRSVSNGAFFLISNTRDIDIGYIAPNDLTIVRATIRCENTQGNNATNDLVLNASIIPLHTSTSMPSGVPLSINNGNLDIDVNINDLMRVQHTGATWRDTVITLYAKVRI